MSETNPDPETFFGKILLFGEYSILLDGNAIAIPLQQNSFSGVLRLDNQKTQNPVWNEWLDYLLELRDSQFHELAFDWQRFEKDIDAGLYFDSTLPIGYGLGSSGALTAAVFKKYISEFQWDLLKSDLKKLQKTLGTFESFFHGRSSGLDPLVSVLNAPIQISGTVTSLLPKLSPDNSRNWFLVDSGLSRQTSLLVEIFRKKIETDQNFEKKMQELKAANNKCIQNFLEQKTEQLEDGMRNISNIQFTQMDWLIPANIKSSWEEGLKTDRFYFKLCGAGGGGFYLVYIPEKKDQIILNQSLGIINLHPVDEVEK
jgi:mevalonate kinase